MLSIVLLCYARNIIVGVATRSSNPLHSLMWQKWLKTRKKLNFRQKQCIQDWKPCQQPMLQYHAFAFCVRTVQLVSCASVSFHGFSLQTVWKTCQHEKVLLVLLTRVLISAIFQDKLLFLLVQWNFYNELEFTYLQLSYDSHAVKE